MTVGGPLSSDAATIRSQAGYRLQPCKALAMLYVDVFRRQGFGFTKWCFLWQSVHPCRSVGRCRIGGCSMQIRGRHSCCVPAVQEWVPGRRIQQCYLGIAFELRCTTAEMEDGTDASSRCVYW